MPPRRMPRSASSRVWDRSRSSPSSGCCAMRSAERLIASLEDAPATDVLAGQAVIDDALDGAATVGLNALSDRVETLREEFLATTVHDIRQPITLVTGSLDLAARWLSEPEFDSERVTESVNDAVVAANEINVMLDTLGDASRLAMGALEPDPEPAKLEAIVGDALALLDAERAAASRSSRIRDPVGRPVGPASASAGRVEPGQQRPEVLAARRAGRDRGEPGRRWPRPARDARPRDGPLDRGGHRRVRSLRPRRARPGTRASRASVSGCTPAAASSPRTAGRSCCTPTGQEPARRWSWRCR